MLTLSTSPDLFEKNTLSSVKLKEETDEDHGFSIEFQNPAFQPNNIKVIVRKNYVEEVTEFNLIRAELNDFIKALSRL